MNDDLAELRARMDYLTELITRVADRMYGIHVTGVRLDVHIGGGQRCEPRGDLRAVE